MPFVRIPDRYREGVGVLATLDDAVFSELYSALERAPSETATYEELATKVAGEIKRLDAPQVNKILRFLTSAYRLRLREDVAPEKLASDLYDALGRDKEVANPVTNERATDFKSRLTRLLGLESLGVVATKARELETDIERGLCSAKILTDLRPIFGSEPSVGPTAMMIVHTLKLSYHDMANGEHREIFIGIDNEDIVKLKQVVQRAESKAKGLASSSRRRESNW